MRKSTSDDAAMLAKSQKLPLPIEEDFIAALNLACSLVRTGNHSEAKTFLRKQVPKAQAALGEGNDAAIRLRWSYAEAYYTDKSASREDLVKALAILEEVSATRRRFFGPAHPTTKSVESKLQIVQEMVASFDAPSPSA